ncbi:MAG: DUF2264 domain-containing protein [Verrucomicrobiota bacterium]
MRTRADWCALANALWQPMESRYRGQRGSVRFGEWQPWYDRGAESLEAFSRGLWSLVPLEMGGGSGERKETWNLMASILAEGTDPGSGGFFGEVGDYDSRIVEIAAWGYCLLALPETIWPRLSASEQARVAAWFGQVNQARLPDNNWRFFRVFINLGLRSVGEDWSQTAIEADLAHLESCYLGGGWYEDGPGGHRDYYVAWAFHTYGLILARHVAPLYPEQTARYRERAREFAPDFVRWFARNGAAVPFGRSLTYRFAQGAFFGALAYADEAALPWGMVRGLLSRHLRWWLRQPLFDAEGKLSIGYAYPNPLMGESYNSSGSPYWALKAFLPLALPQSHPFWQAEEAELPEENQPVFQSGSDFLLTRDAWQGHVLLLNNHESGNQFVRHGAAKYAKLAYSSAFSLSFPMKEGSLEHGGFDNVLAVSEDGEYWRVREKPEARSRHGQALYSRWRPWPGWVVETWLVPVMPGYAAIHHISAPQAAHAYAGGFGLPLGERAEEVAWRSSAIEAQARTPLALSRIRLLAGTGQARLTRPEPNTHLLHPRFYQVGMRCPLESGCQWLAYAAVAWELPLPADAGAVIDSLHFCPTDRPSLSRDGETVWEALPTTPA